jgi:hypothetical protein
MAKKRRRPNAPPSEHDIESEGLPSASAFDAEFRCPGKRALCAKLPKEDDNAATLRGQRIHAALEKGDFSDLSDSDARLASRIAYGESELVHEYNFEGAQIEFEERIWDFDEHFNHTWSARVDRYDWQPHARRLLVIDDKSGWTTPPPIHINWQVRSEGALLAERLDAIETVVALIHPLHFDSLWEARVYNRKQSDNLLDYVRHGVQLIQQPDQRRIVGSIQCQYCTAKRICPEYIAADAALDVAIADEITDQGFTAINRRTKEERGEHVRQLKEKQKNIEFILSQYVTVLERDPDAITGWRLNRKMDRSVTDEVKAMEVVRAEFGPDVLYACLKFSVKALEDELAKGSTRKEAKEKLSRSLGALLKFKKSKNFLDEARSL